MSYSENENCVVRSDLEIDAANAADLVGKKLAVPLGTGAYYSFLRQMEHFGVDVSTLDVVDMAPPESAAALSQGAIDMACGWGGSLNRMKEAGNVLLTGAERQEPGILVFDVTSAPAAFVAENPDILAKFVKVTADANAAWVADASDETLETIAREAGMEGDAARTSLSTFEFPSIKEQLSETWFGGNAAAHMKGVADVFVGSGSILRALDSYTGTINIDPLQDAFDM